MDDDNVAGRGGSAANVTYPWSFGSNNQSWTNPCKQRVMKYRSVRNISYFLLLALLAFIIFTQSAAALEFYKNESNATTDATGTTTLENLSLTLNKLVAKTDAIIKSFFGASPKASETIEIRDTKSTPVISGIKTYNETKQQKQTGKTISISVADVPDKGELEVDALASKNVAVKLKVNTANRGEVNWTVRFNPTSWESYNDSVHNYINNNFIAGQQTVYMFGTGFGAKCSYKVSYYDNNNTKRSTEAINADSSGNLSSSYTFESGPDAAGTWHAQVFNASISPLDAYDTSNTNVIADDSFSVDITAIPSSQPASYYLLQVH